MVELELKVFAAIIVNHTDLSCLALYPLKQRTYCFYLATHFFSKIKPKLWTLHHRNREKNLSPYDFLFF